VGLRFAFRPKMILSCSISRETVSEIHVTQMLQTLSSLCEISSSHGGVYDVQNCLLGCTAV
jgi:hypothetical protein